MVRGRAEAPADADDRADLSERGLGLVEALVAIALLAVVTAVALDLLDQSRRAFQLGENAVETRQSVRSGWHRLVAELRAAGLGSDPDGDARRPDEPIELALPGALVLRADLDGWDPSRAHVPETALAGGVFATVPIGNDEIVGFALAPSSGAGRDRFTFEADVIEAARDGDVEPVTIAGVSLAHDAPPYTLYRLHLNPDPSGGPLVVRTPLLDNVRTLAFRYYDRSGTRLPAVGGADDVASRLARARIARVELELRGLDRDPDPASGQRREFVLVGTVTPRNLARPGRASRR